MRRKVRAHFEKAVTLAAFVAVIVFMGVLFQTFIIRNKALIGQVYSPAIILLTNLNRAERQIGELTVNPVLEKAAQMKADDMVSKGYFAHTSPDGVTPWYWFQQAGYEYVYAGENLAVNFTDSHKVDQAWMNSEFHRKNILDGRFTEIGVATSKGYFNGKETVFVVQMFGAPKGGSVVATSPSSLYASNALMSLLVSNPERVLRTIFVFIGILIMLGLLAYVGVELRRHHFRHVLYGIVVLLLLAAGLVVYQYLFNQSILVG